MRNIIIGSGNYNEHIKGDYVEGMDELKVIVISSKTNRFGDKTISKTIGNYKITEEYNRFTDFTRTVEGPDYKSKLTMSRFGDKSESLSASATLPNEVKKLIESSSLKKDTSVSQTVVGNNNNVIQQSNSNIAIGHMNGGHIGDNVTIAGSINQTVSGNNNRVNQSMFTNMSVNGDLDVGNLTQDTDFWEEEKKEEKPLTKYETTVKEFADYITTKASVLESDGKTSTALLLAADDVISVIEGQSLLVKYINSNTEEFFSDVKEIIRENKLAWKLLNVVISTY